MGTSHLESSSAAEQDVALGTFLGRREAFSLISGRCSAAEADALRSIREEKLYERVSPGWDEFCSERLHISRSNADRLIRLLDEFGPRYFEVSLCARLSPQTYRSIAPAIGEDGLQWNGETIALTRQNSARITTAVADLRRRKAAAPPPTAKRLAALEKRGGDLIAEATSLAADGTSPQDKARLRLTVRQFIGVFQSLEHRLRS